MANERDRFLYAGRHLLDHEITGIHGELIGKVEDAELGHDPAGSTYITALHTGQAANGRRLGGLLGTLIRTSAERLRSEDDPPPRRFAAALIRSIGHTVVLNVPADELPPPGLELWLRDHLIGRIPGAS